MCACVRLWSTSVTWTAPWFVSSWDEPSKTFASHTICFGECLHLGTWILNFFFVRLQNMIIANPRARTHFLSASEPPCSQAAEGQPPGQSVQCSLPAHASCSAVLCGWRPEGRVWPSRLAGLHPHQRCSQGPGRGAFQQTGRKESWVDDVISICFSPISSAKSFCCSLSSEKVWMKWSSSSPSTAAVDFLWTPPCLSRESTFRYSTRLCMCGWHIFLHPWKWLICVVGTLDFPNIHVSREFSYIVEIKGNSFLNFQYSHYFRDKNCFLTYKKNPRNI